MEISFSPHTVALYVAQKALAKDAGFLFLCVKLYTVLRCNQRRLCHWTCCWDDAQSRTIYRLFFLLLGSSSCSPTNPVRAERWVRQLQPTGETKPSLACTSTAPNITSGWLWSPWVVGLLRAGLVKGGRKRGKWRREAKPIHWHPWRGIHISPARPNPVLNA